MATKSSNKDSRLFLRISEDLKKIIMEKAKESDLSVTDYIIQSIQMQLSQDTTDTNILLYHYEELKRQITKTDNKVEELGQLFLAYLTAFFRTQPELTNDEKGAYDWGKANQKAVDFLTVHRNKLRKDNKPFMYRIFGNLLEVDGTFQGETKTDTNE